MKLSVNEIRNGFSIKTLSVNQVINFLKFSDTNFLKELLVVMDGFLVIFFFLFLSMKQMTFCSCSVLGKTFIFIRHFFLLNRFLTK